jgi:ABC-2 type transport system ATP-binding protein
MAYTIDPEVTPLLQVSHLVKRYVGFTLDDVSFGLDPGYIMGFIGRNGAGKTTTLKLVMGLVRADAGTVAVCGQDFRAHELALKQQIGFALGETPFYPRTRLSAITSVYRRFYEAWDDAAYGRLLRRFDIDPAKKVGQLSAGMKVKYSLALALSHGARLLILDEPTSGLDPVSRDEVLDFFQELIEDGTRSILFSTHITSDLDKCADFLTYIADGRVVASQSKDDFIASYRLVRGTRGQLDQALRAALVGLKEHQFGFTGLIHTDDLTRLGLAGLEPAAPTVEDIMVYREHGLAGEE